MKVIRNKAVAMEIYFKLADNMEAERRACEIRLRAERKAGRLLRKSKKAKGKRTDLVVQDDQVNGTTSDAKTLSEMGITKDQSSKWQKLTSIPEYILWRRKSLELLSV